MARRACIADNETMNSKPYRNLLVIAFHYPPDNSSTGVLRTLKFTQYLLDFGWRCEVISVPEHLYPNRDPQLVGDVPPEVRVHRPWAADSRKLFGIRGRYPGFLSVPDRYWTWYFAATRTARKLLSTGKIDAIYSTSPIPTAHLIAHTARKISGLPWIADFRDSWVDGFLGPVRFRVDGWLERGVIARADRVVMNTPAARRYYLERYPAQPASKFVTITNGYDENDFRDLDFSSGDAFEVISAGWLNDANRDPEAVLKAAALALERGWIPRSELRLTLLGAGPYAASQRFQDQLRRYKLQENTEVTVSRVPYGEALRRQARADVVVVLTDDARRMAQNRDWTFMAVPAKLYEYLRLGKFMLVLSRAEAVRELLADVHAPAPLFPSDIEGVASALREAYLRRARKATPVPDPAIRKYERRELTRELALVLDGMTCGATPPTEAP
jgi:glycosyltransferase involved in cell wall biosynthesis